jgi:hypothetical protein
VFEEVCDAGVSFEAGRVSGPSLCRLTAYDHAAIPEVTIRRIAWMMPKLLGT